MERVVVTGMGIASPLGCTVPEFWEGLLAGRCGVVALEDDEFKGLRSRIGALAAGYDEAEHFSRKEARRMSRSSKLALVAAAQAVEQTCLSSSATDRAEVGVMIGSSIGGFSASDHFFRDFYLDGHLSPFTIPISMNNGPSSQVSMRYGFQGPLINIDAACASGTHSVGNAFNLIRSGALRMALVGGADTPFSRGVMQAWCALRALSERNDSPADACRPFSADRDGMVLGEGAGVLVVEAERHALERSAPILAEINGYGASSDSSHLTQPSREGPVHCMRRALRDARMEPEQIDYLNAHATGTISGDRNETAAIKEVFGARAARIPVVANKAAFGHSIAASGALELIGCVMALHAQCLPPTINYREPDPECDLDYVIEGSRPHPMQHIMSNSFAFGGSNAAVIIGRYEPGHDPGSA